jgi:hypothetical protein
MEANPGTVDKEYLTAVKAAGINRLSFGVQSAISFSHCWIKFQGTAYNGFVYYPDPKTKKEHFQDMSTVEVLAPFVDGIKYKDELEISLNPEEIKIISPV